MDSRFKLQFAFASVFCILTFVWAHRVSEKATERPTLPALSLSPVTAAAADASPIFSPAQADAMQLSPATNAGYLELLNSLAGVPQEPAETKAEATATEVVEEPPVKTPVLKYKSKDGGEVTIHPDFRGDRLTGKRFRWKDNDWQEMSADDPDWDKAAPPTEEQSRRAAGLVAAQPTEAAAPPPAPAVKPQKLFREEDVANIDMVTRDDKGNVWVLIDNQWHTVVDEDQKSFLNAMFPDNPPQPAIPAITPAPLAPPSEVAPAPDPSVIAKGPELLTVSIRAPVESIIGDGVDLLLEETGKVVARKWTIAPEGTRGLRILGEGERAVFDNREPGVYVIFVSVAGADGSVAHDVTTVILRHELPPVAAEIDDIRQRETVTNEGEPQEQKIRIEELIAGWTADVASPQKSEEAAIMAGTFRTVASLVGTNRLAANNPIGEVSKGVRAAIGPERAAGWNPWLTKIQQLLSTLKQQGALSDPAHLEAALIGIANILDQVQ